MCEIDRSLAEPLGSARKLSLLVRHPRICGVGGVGVCVLPRSNIASRLSAFLLQNIDVFLGPPHT